MNQEYTKLDRFDGMNYTHWQDKLMFLLTTLKVSYVLDPDLEPILPSVENGSVELIAKRNKRKIRWFA